MIDAEKYARYLIKFPFTRRAVYLLSWQDVIQIIYLVWLLLNRPEDPEGRLNFDIVREVRRLLYRYSHRYSYENPFNDEKYYQIDDENEDSAKDRFIRRILNFYKNHTATETIRFFNLPDTIKVRKALSNCLPKPERKSGKKKGEKRIKISTDKSFNQLLAEGVPRATAWRASKRGYYFRKIEKEA